MYRFIGTTGGSEQAGVWYWNVVCKVARSCKKLLVILYFCKTLIAICQELTFLQVSTNLFAITKHVCIGLDYYGVLLAYPLPDRENRGVF